MDNFIVADRINMFKNFKNFSKNSKIAKMNNNEYGVKKHSAKKYVFVVHSNPFVVMKVVN